MNRRHFLQRSSFAAIAVAGLPRAIRRQANYPSVYKTELEDEVADQLYYELGLYHSTVQDFSAAKDEEKVMGLKVEYYETTDHTTATKTGEFKYIIQKSELTDKDSNIWKITTKLDKTISGEYKFPKDYPKNPAFLCMPGTFVKMLGKKDVVLISIPYPPESSSSGDDDDKDCFLTTACVTHKGFDDNCEELATLRFLRNKFMTLNKEGQLMINEYRSIGPAIVNAINSCQNKTDIYEYMHRHMIVPSVELVQQGKYIEATNYYKAFVKALQQQYC